MFQALHGVKIQVIQAYPAGCREANRLWGDGVHALRSKEFWPFSPFWKHSIKLWFSSGRRKLGAMHGRTCIAPSFLGAEKGRGMMPFPVISGQESAH
jgi:hypothetical protein